MAGMAAILLPCVFPRASDRMATQNGRLVKHAVLPAIWLVCALAPGVPAQEGHPLTGSWHGEWHTASEKHPLLFYMKWNSKAVEGTINPGPNAIPPAPYVYGPNEYSLLDKTDLVFVDAPGTGFSRPVGRATIRNSPAPIRTCRPSRASSPSRLAPGPRP